MVDHERMSNHWQDGTMPTLLRSRPRGWRGSSIPFTPRPMSGRCCRTTISPTSQRSPPSDHPRQRRRDADRWPQPTEQARVVDQSLG